MLFFLLGLVELIIKLFLCFGYLLFIIMAQV